MISRSTKVHLTHVSDICHHFAFGKHVSEASLARADNKSIYQYEKWHQPPTPIKYLFVLAKHEVGKRRNWDISKYLHSVRECFSFIWALNQMRGLFQRRRMKTVLWLQDIFIQSQIAVGRHSNWIRLLFTIDDEWDTICWNKFWWIVFPLR